MNVLSREKQITVISLLCEGASIRAVERLTHVHRDTIMRLLVRVGKHCAAIMDQKMRGLRCTELQLDEIWTYVHKKEYRLQPGDHQDYGDQYLFTALDPETKLLPWFLVGKRTSENTFDFVKVLSKRVDGTVQISTDGYHPYAPAVGGYFAGRASHGMVVKNYDQPPDTAKKPRRKFSKLVSVDRVWVHGAVKTARICTSHVERANWTIRGHMRRFTRKSNGFSRKLENLEAAVALFVAWYNLVKPHRSLGGITPAMAAQLTDGFWKTEDLIPQSN